MFYIYMVSYNGLSSSKGGYVLSTLGTSGRDKSLFLIIYMFIYQAQPRITSLIFDTTTRSFTCTSTGSPATTVTWMRDGEPLTIDGVNYQLTQNVTNRSESTYGNILTIPVANQIADITGFKCNVTNALGWITAALTVTSKLLILLITYSLQTAFTCTICSKVEATVSSKVSVMFGGTYSLQCTATVKGILGADVITEWNKIDHGSEQDMQSNQGMLQFTSLQLSDAGQYICRVSVVSSYLTVPRNASATKSINIQSKFASFSVCSLLCESM